MENKENFNKNSSEGFHNSVKWSAYSKYGAQLVQFTTSMVLARLLAPEYFGLLGMANVVVGFVKVFKNVGFNATIVQKEHVSSELLSTLFWFNLLICLLAAIAVIASAPFAALIYGDARVTPIIIALSTTVVLSAFSMVPAALLQRQMEFKRLAIREIGGVAVAAVTAITLAKMQWGVWALVGCTLASTVAETVLINCAVPFLPRLFFSFPLLRENMAFGLNITGFNIFHYFTSNSDVVLIGAFFGPVSLGYYTVAYRFMVLPRDSITNVVTRVLFPKLSRLKNDDARLADAYLRTCGAIAMLTFPIAIGLTLVSHEFVLIVLGEKWLPAEQLLRILVPLGALQSLWTTAGQLMLAKGRSDLHFRWGIVGGVFFILATVAGVPWGLLGVAIAYAIASAMWIPFWFSIAFSLVSTLSLKKLAETLWPYAAASALMGSIVVPAKAGLRAYGLTDFPLLIIAVSIGVISYVALGLLFRPPALVDMLKVIGNRRIAS